MLGKKFLLTVRQPSSSDRSRQIKSCFVCLPTLHCTARVTSHFINNKPRRRKHAKSNKTSQKRPKPKRPRNTEAPKNENNDRHSRTTEGGQPRHQRSRPEGTACRESKVSTTDDGACHRASGWPRDVSRHHPPQGEVRRSRGAFPRHQGRRGG